MAWISTPFLLILFSSIVFFAVSCAFCFMLGRVMGKLDGQDAAGEGRRRGGGDRRGPHRTHAGDRKPAAVRQLPEEPSLADEPVFERSSSA